MPIPKDQVLGLPPDDRDYVEGDFERFYAMTPIPLFELPYYLVDKDLMPGWWSTMVWCGWLRGIESLSKLVETRYPDRVVWAKDDPDDETLVVDTVDTVLELPDIIRQVLELPKQYRNFIRVVDAGCEDGQIDGALVVGNNYTGILPTDSGYLHDIMQEFFDGEEPNWFLDKRYWMWSPPREEVCAKRI